MTVTLSVRHLLQSFGFQVHAVPSGPRLAALTIFQTPGSDSSEAKGCQELDDELEDGSARSLDLLSVSDDQRHIVQSTLTELSEEYVDVLFNVLMCRSANMSWPRCPHLREIKRSLEFCCELFLSHEKQQISLNLGASRLACAGVVTLPRSSPGPRLSGAAPVHRCDYSAAAAALCLSN
ncbi:hypothetical protein EYF80_046888 [Liparis tanakae]|uniref:Uncharacterized protein n=1 Tax=Liparis tanakae TaxID=230148 RepID=A0A4Z2FPT2_9TELE|nr:hypothetical protein EYF80_046888 [Liparis tanakae]